MSERTFTCAVAGSPARLRGALEAGSVRPDAVMDGTPDLATALQRALTTGAAWVWVLDGAAVPRPGALAALLAALERADGLPAPALLAGAVRTPDGRADAGRTPWYARGDPEPAMAAVERRLLPIRASAGPVLVARHAAEADPPPAGAPLAAGSILVWTARLLRARPGYLVPDSEHEAPGPGPDPALEPRTAVSLVAGRAFTGTDRLRVGVELVERALRGARRRAS